MTQRILSPAAPVKVRLLQDAIYSEDDDLWELLQRYRQHLQDYFRELGLDLVVHEEDGFAYLRQLPDEETAGLPRLTRRDKLTKGLAIIGILLREHFCISTRRSMTSHVLSSAAAISRFSPRPFSQTLRTRSDQIGESTVLSLRRRSSACFANCQAAKVTSVMKSGESSKRDSLWRP